MQQHSPFWWLGVAVAGLLVGVVSGLFGVGGGFLLTPLLTVAFGVPIDVAVGTGLCQMVGAATAGQIRYARLKAGEPKLGLMMVGGGLCGVLLGARVVHALSAVGAVTTPGGAQVPAVRLWLSGAYVLLLGGIAFWTVRDARRTAGATPTGGAAPAGGPLTRLGLPPATPLPRLGRPVSVPAVALVGLGMGFLSGLLGIGGGVILVPLLVYGVGMEMAAAAATGMVMLLATSLVGTATHARMGHVDLPLALVLMAGSTFGAQAGATLAAGRLAGARLRVLFAGLVTLTAAGVSLDLLRLLFVTGR